MMFEIAAVTHAGRRRPTNEDRVLVDVDRGLAVVADGMGGERGGELAAAAACRAIADAVAQVAADVPALHAALGAAAHRVAALGQSAELDHMGTTVAAVRLVAREAIAEIGHVGDVRVYVLRAAASATLAAAAPRYCPPAAAPSGAMLVCTTRDHSSVCELVERGHLERPAALHHPLRSRISRALGGRDPRADVRLIPLLFGDRLLVCSDGLWSAVPEPELARLLEHGATAAESCDALLEAALAAGGEDNIGIAVMHWRGAEARAATAPSVTATAAPDGEPPESRQDPPLPGVLATCARDLTAAARRGELDPVLGRDHEILELARVLVGRRKPNALLIGEPGVGKTSLVEGLAQRIVAPDAGELARLRIVELSLTELVAGTTLRGELEARIASIVELAEREPDIVVFIDELHAIASGEPGATIASALKPALARGKLRVIGATSTAEYERALARDEALTRRFEVITIGEPAPEAARAMLAGLRARLESHYQITIDADALDAAVELAIRYLPDRRLPDKAVDLLDRACARRMLERVSRGPGPVAPLSRHEVAVAVADRCRVPVALVERDAGEVLAALDAGLRARIKGQDDALAAIAATLRRAHTALRDPGRPVASLLLAGPTGVGKTATAHAIAELLFGRDAIVRVDMSELADPAAVARLVGAAPGYVGYGDDGQLTGPVRRRPASVVLLDEVEKAHPDALALLLQVLGDGALTDGRGRTTSFREALVIMTTNLPLEEARPRAGFVRDPVELDRDAVDQAHRTALARRLRPELVSRIDAVITFRALDRADHAAIVDVVVGRLEDRLRAQGVVPPPGHATRQRVLARLDALAFGVRQVERIAEQALADALDPRGDGGPRDVVMDSIRSRVQVAMLLVDVVGSTRMVQSIGDTEFVGVVRKLVDAVRCHPTATDLQFLKCTGDGVLALYGSVASAIDAGRDLREVVVAGTRAELRRVVHHGRVRHGPLGDFLGVELHRLFRLEHAVKEPVLVISAMARAHLEPAERDQLRAVGAVRIPDVCDPVELWLVPEEAS